MSGTREGGLRAAEKNLAKDPLYYSKIGRRGGSVRGTPKGFASMTREQVSKAGAKGGKISRRGKAKDELTPKVQAEF